jgi:amino acid adenylation domain-containing protein
MQVHLVQDYLLKTTSNYPQKTAITDGITSITFDKLAADSDQLAGFLIELGVSIGDHVVYYMKRDPSCLVATVAILKAGAAYIPVDPKMPPERVCQIIKDSKPKVVICDDSTLNITIEFQDQLSVYYFHIVSLDYKIEASIPCGSVFFKDDVQSVNHLQDTLKGKPDDVAYVLYTSGSTGIPKGVMVTHRNIRNYIDWAVSFFKITANDNLLGTAPLHFDMSTFDIFCPFLSGATLFLATGYKLLFPEQLTRFIEDSQITVWKGVSSLLMYMCRANVVKFGRMKSLKTVIYAGEPLATQYLIDWMRALPQASFYNGYGPTEATGISLCYHVKHIPKPSEKIPIGHPCKGAQVVVLGDDGQSVNPGDIGELCISGVCLSKGYLNDNEKTRSNFTAPPTGSDLGDRIYHTGDLVQQSPTGEYVFISRKDQQVKWMGYRIELGEIETNLLAHPKVNDAVVLKIETSDVGISELIAFFESDEILSGNELSGFLGRLLPNYMVPQNYIQVKYMPRNDRGKISRQEIIRMYKENKCLSNEDSK